MRPPPGASAAAISAVLGNDDLLREILLRVGFPTSLVRAAAVAKRWLRHASDPAFLRRFRDRHPPALLGFYLREALFPRPRFVPVSEAPELAAAVRRAGSTVIGEKFYIMDCRNGRLRVADVDPAVQKKYVLSPLHPTRGKIAIPPAPRDPDSRMRFFLLPEQDGYGDAVVVDMRKMDTKLQVSLLTLQSGVWVDHSSAVIDMPEIVPDVGSVLMPVGSVLMPICGRIYMFTYSRHILRLDIAAAKSCVFQLPDRVRTGNFKLSCAQEDSGLFLIYTEGYLLSIWRLAANIDDVKGWELVYDSIPVREACSRHEDVVVKAVDDAIDFVFLILKESRAIICMHLRSRTEKAYDNRLQLKSTTFFDIFPFKMVWPPTFPALGEENNQEE